MYNIIVSLTTISSRLEHIHLVIRSLLDQDFPSHVYEVRLHLSEHPYLLDEGCLTVTSELRHLQKQYPRRFTIRYVENSGPYRKILPVLEDIYNQPTIDFYNTLIVTVDDDTIYPREWLSQLYEAYRIHRCVIGFRGRAIRTRNEKITSYNKWFKKIDENPSPLNVPTGKDGILYSVLHLHPEGRSLKAALQYAPKADDLWLKAHTLLSGVPTYLINNTLEQELPSVMGKEPQVSLYRSFNQCGGNDKALASIEQYLESRYSTNFTKLISSDVCNAEKGFRNVIQFYLRNI